MGLAGVDFSLGTLNYPVSQVLLSWPTLKSDYNAVDQNPEVQKMLPHPQVCKLVCLKVSHIGALE